MRKCGIKNRGKKRAWFVIKNIFLVALLTGSFLSLFSQDHNRKPVHREQSEYFKSHPWPEVIVGRLGSSGFDTCSLEKLVFGYHPYWMGDSYLNYRWNLLSDLSFFSYEVDPATGGPVTTHGWLTAPVIDSALANEVRVHLCVTLFSGHATFFSNELAKQTLIDSLIHLVSGRGAHGINLDFEAVPSSQGTAMVDYVLELSAQVKDTLPDCIISMAIPAVDWTNIFDISRLNEALDLFFIMGYDYYWNGSSMAGPVSPLYSMTAGYDHSLARTVSSYQVKGIPNEKFLLGLPYYARQWPTQYPVAPSPVAGYGTALTWANVKNNSVGYYDPENRLFEPASISTYYSFGVGSSWYQCFVAEPMDLRERYDLVNYRGLAGTGIWALGYDNGYDHLWNVLADKFSTCVEPMFSDTLYDSGGPFWPYYDNEDYSLTIRSYDNTPIMLEFLEFDIEYGYDSLWVFDGGDTLAPPLGGFSGTGLPPVLQSSGEMLTIRFRSDGLTVGPGWKAVWRSGTAGVREMSRQGFRVFPNPAGSVISYQLSDNSGFEDCRIEIWDMIGKRVETIIVPGGRDVARSDVSGYPSGVYTAVLRNNEKILGVRKIVVE